MLPWSIFYASQLAFRLRFWTEVRVNFRINLFHVFDYEALNFPHTRWLNKLACVSHGQFMDIVFPAEFWQQSPREFGRDKRLSRLLKEN